MKNYICFVVLIIAIMLISACKNDKIKYSEKNNYSVQEKQSLSMNKKQKFDSIKIGSIVWMKNNLNVTTFRNGDTIFHAKSILDWVRAGKEEIPAYCLSKTKCEKLYNWYAVNDNRSLAPVGWKIPSKDDYKELIQYFNGNISKIYSCENHDTSVIFNSCSNEIKLHSGELKNTKNSLYYWLSEEGKMLKEDNLNRANCLFLNSELSMVSEYPASYGLLVKCIKK